MVSRLLKLACTTELLAGIAMARCPPPLGETLVPAQLGPACAAIWKVTGFAFPGARPQRPWTLVCQEGDPSCDNDGIADGVCRFAVNACVEQAVEGCIPEPVRALRFAKSSRRALAGFVPPPAPSAGEACGTRGIVALPLRGPQRRHPASLTLVSRARAASGTAKNRLTLRCVLGAGGMCPLRASRGPTTLHLEIGRGSDIDFLPAPGPKSFAFPAPTALRFCLMGCDASTRPRCAAIGGTGPGSLNGETFGAPQPVASAGVGICVVHRYVHDICGTFQLDTGEASIEMGLRTDVYLAESTMQPCPVCEASGDVGSQGRCSASAARPRAPCVVEGFSSRGDALSSQCLPAGGEVAGLRMNVPLTTGTSSLAPGSRPCPEQSVPVGCFAEGACDAACVGAACVALDGEGRCITTNGGVAQACCSNAPTSECFSADDPISRSGLREVPQPAWPDPSYPKTSTGMVLGSAFCVSRTGAFVGWDTQTGPGALILPVERLTVFGWS